MGRKGRCGRKKALSEAGTRRVLAKLVLGERYRATYQSVGDELGVSYATVFAARWGNEKGGAGDGGLEYEAVGGGGGWIRRPCFDCSRWCKGS